MAAPKILIVDDEPFNVDTLEQELADLDYRTVSAFDGQDALDKVDCEAPDLVLLDIRMPVMDGFEVLRRLKACAKTRDIPVIVISANNDLDSVVRGIALGAEDYLPKPFELALLRARLSSSLEKKRLRDLEQIYLKSMQRELEIGREIQAGFLPAELPEVAGWEIAAYFKASHEVAGDFYDVFWLPDGNLMCLIGDVCDKGVGAALFMSLFRSLIRAIASSELTRHGENPAMLNPAERLSQVITFTNDYIADVHAEASMFATLFIGIFNPQGGRLDYMNCGHEAPLWVKPGGSIFPLRRTGPAVGVIPGADYGVEQIDLEKDDLLLAFTDGVPDAINAVEEVFGKGRLLEIVKRSELPPCELLEQIEQAVGQFRGNARQFDDITLLAIKRAL